VHEGDHATLGPAAFQRFLTWLDEGSDSGGQRYLEVRRRLVSYFRRKRCAAADELADETLNRVARRLEEQGTITDATPARYCYIVARFVFLEYLRRPERRNDALSEEAGPAAESPDAGLERRLEILEDCLARLTADERGLIRAYYRGDKRDRISNRRALSAKLGLTQNALSIRACRIRSALEACVRRRLSE
jgi:DNA-directed RNA polymerase specialized sigma24 family protein